MSMKEYLSFTKRERTGILALVAILILVAILPHFIPERPRAAESLPVAQLQQRHAYPDSFDRHSYRSWVEDSSRGGREQPYGGRWRQYGPRERTDRIGAGGGYERRRPYQGGYRSGPWYRDTYRNKQSGKGSREQEPDFRREAGTVYKNEEAGYFPAQRRFYSKVEINTADTAAFIALPGIGSKLAARIVSFRKKLGGFSSVEQMKAVYGLKDSVYMVLLPYLRCDSGYAVKDNADYTTIR